MNLNLQEFFHSLNQVTWQEVYEETDVNKKFSIFMDLFLHCYNNAFPIKIVCVRDNLKSTGLPKELKFPVKNAAVRQSKKDDSYGREGCRLY